MNTFELNIEKLVQMLLPTFLRKPAATAFLNTLVTPLQSMQQQFNSNRNENLYRLYITPQVCYLEKMLNDRFDPVLRRIYIQNGFFTNIKYIYTHAEYTDPDLEKRKPRTFIYAHDEEEGTPLFIYLHGESNYLGDDFIVCLPVDLVVNEEEIRGLIELYKLPTKKYRLDRIIIKE